VVQSTNFEVGYDTSRREATEEDELSCCLTTSKKHSYMEEAIKMVKNDSKLAVWK
jgi:hypothetical protein